MSSNSTNQNIEFINYKVQADGFYTFKINQYSKIDDRNHCWFSIYFICWNGLILMKKLTKKNKIIIVSSVIGIALVGIRLRIYIPLIL